MCRVLAGQRDVPLHPPVGFLPQLDVAVGLLDPVLGRQRMCWLTTVARIAWLMAGVGHGYWAGIDCHGSSRDPCGGN